MRFARIPQRAQVRQDCAAFKERERTVARGMQCNVDYPSCWHDVVSARRAELHAGERSAQVREDRRIPVCGMRLW